MDVSSLLGGSGESQGLRTGESQAVRRRDLLALSIPLVEVAQLHGEQRRLDRVQARVGSATLVRVPRSLPVVPELSQATGQTIVIGRHKAPVARGTQVLRGIEAETAGDTQAPAPPVSRHGAVRLAGVLQNDKALAL